MGCYLMVTNQLFLGQTGELSIGKASESAAKLSSKVVKELEIASYRITFCHFPLCFIKLNDFFTLIFLGNLQ